MIIEAFYIAVFWWVYIHITSKPDMIMNWFYVKLDSITHRFSKLNKLLSCEYCLGGFTALWAYPFIFEYNFFLHFIFIAITVFIVHLLNIINSFYEEY